MLVHAAEPATSWLKTYPIREFGAQWHYDYQVKNLKKNKDKILDILKKNNGELTQPLESFPNTKDDKFQQLSYKIRRNDAEKVLKELNKIASIKRSTQKDDNSTYIEEASEKLIRLRTDTETEKDAIKRMPTVSELTKEYQAHLEKVVKSYEDSKDQVLLNLVLEEK
jgi:hypothetical protein